MLPTSHLLAFALLSFVLIIVPGPNVLFVVSRSLMLGRAAGVGTAAGGQIGVYLQVVAVAFGVGALVERSVAIFTVIKPGPHGPQGLTGPRRPGAPGQPTTARRQSAGLHQAVADVGRVLRLPDPGLLQPG